MALCGLAKISQYRLPSSWWWGVNLWKYVDQLRERFLQTNMQGLKTHIYQNACLTKRDWNVFLTNWCWYNVNLDFSPRAPWNPSPEPERRQWQFFQLLWVRRAKPCFGNRSLRNSLDRMSSLQRKSEILLKFAFHLSNLTGTFKRLTWILWSRLGTVAKWTVSNVAGSSAGTPSSAPFT